MDHSAAKRRDSVNTCSPMPPPPVPGPQRMYTLCDGTQIPEQKFKQHFDLWQKFKQEGKQIPEKLELEILWSLSEHYPNHPVLKGRRPPPPPHTNREVVRAWEVRQQELQQRQPQQQRPTNAVLPNMVLPNSSQRGLPAQRQAGGSIVLDPRLANASSTAIPQVWSPSMQSTARAPSLQPRGTPPQARSTSVGYQAPPGSMAPPQSTYRASSAAPTSLGIRSSSQAPYEARPRAPSAPTQTLGHRSSSAVPHPEVRSPSRLSPCKAGQTTISHPPTTSFYPSPVSLSSGLEERRSATPTFQNGYNAGVSPQMGMFPPPVSRSASAHSMASSLAQNEAHMKVNVNVNKDGTPGQGLSQRSVLNKAGLKPMSTIDMLVDNELRMMVKLNPAMAAKCRVWAAGWSEVEKHTFIKQFRAKTKKLAAGKMQPPSRPASATQQDRTHEVIDLTGQSKKRKDPPTFIEQPKTKRQITEQNYPNTVINLTTKKRKDPPTSIAQPNKKRHLIDSTSTQPARLQHPSPTLPSTELLHAHALTHGVSMSDIELDSIQTARLAWLQHHADLRAAHSLLDPDPAIQIRMACEHTKSTRPTFHAEPTIAAAIRKVKSGQYDYNWSGCPGGVLPHVNQDAYRACIGDEQGVLRAPEEMGPSEERANVLWEFDVFARGIEC